MISQGESEITHDDIHRGDVEVRICSIRMRRAEPSFADGERLLMIGERVVELAERTIDAADVVVGRSGVWMLQPFHSLTDSPSLLVILERELQITQSLVD